MSKRFISTDLMYEDWFLEMPIGYKLFWIHVLLACDHAGFYKVNNKLFYATNNVKIDPKKAIEYFNFKKDRIRVVKDGFWFIEDFISFQYGHYLNPNSNTHKSIIKLLKKFNINILSIRGLREVYERSGRGLEEV